MWKEIWPDPEGHGMLWGLSPALRAHVRGAQRGGAQHTGAHGSGAALRALRVAAMLGGKTLTNLTWRYLSQEQKNVIWVCLRAFLPEAKTHP